MTAVKNAAQMVLALPEFKSVNAANSTIVRPTVQANESAVLSLICPIYGRERLVDSCTVVNSTIAYASNDYVLNFRSRSLHFYQLDLNFSSIKLDRTLMLHNGSFTRSNYSRVVDDCDLSVLNGLLDQYFIAADYQRLHHKKHMAALCMLVANLLLSSRYKKPLLINRMNGVEKDNNPLRFDNRLIAGLCDWLSSEGYISLIVQPKQLPRNSYKALSILYPSEKLIRLILNYRVLQGGSSVVIRNDMKEEISIPKDKAVLLKVKDYKQVLEDYFKLTSNVLFTLDDTEIFTLGRRIFNRNIDLGGRFYSNYQNISSHDRKRIQINTEKTIELDYKSIHYNILYSMAAVKLVGDAYTIDGYDRNVIKLISLQLLNTEGKEGISHLARMITRSGNPKQIEAFKEYAYQRFIYDESVKKGLRVEPPYKSKNIEYHIDSIPVGTDGKQLINDLLERHKAIRHLIGSKDIGLRLQNMDSNIMKEVMKTATSEFIPLLFVHDSCICKYSDRARVKQIMIETYKSFTGFNIKVTQ